MCSKGEKLRGNATSLSVCAQDNRGQGSAGQLMFVAVTEFPQSEHAHAKDQLLLVRRRTNLIAENGTNRPMRTLEKGDQRPEFLDLFISRINEPQTKAERGSG